MIDLSKSQSPESTQEEMQDFVNRVYNYAADLYLNHNMSWHEVRIALIEQGLNSNDADTVVDNLRKQESDAKSKVANKELGYGALWAVGGIALTAISSGTVIFWGAVVWGGWLMIKGLYHKMG